MIDRVNQLGRSPLVTKECHRLCASDADSLSIEAFTPISRFSPLMHRGENLDRSCGRAVDEREGEALEENPPYARGFWRSALRELGYTSSRGTDLRHEGPSQPRGLFAVELCGGPQFSAGLRVKPD
jgi:hypothetical protein